MLVFAKSSAEAGDGNETILTGEKWALWAVIGLLQRECSQTFSLYEQNSLPRPTFAGKQRCDQEHRALITRERGILQSPLYAHRLQLPESLHTVALPILDALHYEDQLEEKRV